MQSTHRPPSLPIGIVTAPAISPVALFSTGLLIRQRQRLS